MHKTVQEAEATVENFLRHVEAKSTVDVVVCPPFICLPAIHSILRNTHVKLGAQDCFWKESGAFTGQISPRMLYSAGCAFCIVGHSETRGRFGKLDVPESTIPYFHETNETVNLKLKELLNFSINPILCVGETREERDAGKTDEVIMRQVRTAIEGIDPAEITLFSIAYEPVWSIGTGNPCSGEEAERIAAMIRSYVVELTEEWVGDYVRVLYGGSVSSKNCESYFRQPNIDGALVGGASLDPMEFSLIVMSA
jgi:triosephosphate isomerase